MFLLVALLAGAVLAYVVFTGQVNYVVQTQKVAFYNWSTKQTSTSCVINENVYAGITTIDANATYGIRNTDTGAKDCQLWIDDDIKNPSQLSSINVTILSPSGVKRASCIWSGGALPTTPQSFTIGSGEYLTIRIEITGSSTATPAQTGTVTLQLQVPS